MGAGSRPVGLEAGLGLGGGKLLPSGRGRREEQVQPAAPRPYPPASGQGSRGADHEAGALFTFLARDHGSPSLLRLRLENL